MYPSLDASTDLGTLCWVASLIAAHFSRALSLPTIRCPSSTTSAAVSCAESSSVNTAQALVLAEPARQVAVPRRIVEGVVHGALAPWG